DRWPTIALLALQHAEIVLIAVAIATVVGIALGTADEPHPRAGALALAASAPMLTTPSFALSGLCVPLFGLGPGPTVAALVLYAAVPILRNTITGLRSVPSAVDEAARGMGLGRAARMRYVRLPLAWPVIL